MAVPLDADVVVLTSRFAPDRDGGYAVAGMSRLVTLQQAGVHHPLLLTLDVSSAHDIERARARADAYGVPSTSFTMRNLFDEAVRDPQWLRASAAPGERTPGEDYRELRDAGGALVVGFGRGQALDLHQAAALLRLLQTLVDDVTDVVVARGAAAAGLGVVGDVLDLGQLVLLHGVHDGRLLDLEAVADLDVLGDQGAGHAFAEGAALHGKGPDKHWVAETRRALLWGALLPAVIVLLAFLWPLASLLLLLIYPLQLARLARRGGLNWAFFTSSSSTRITKHNGISALLNFCLI